MQEREIKLLFNAGVFESCHATPIAMSRGWTLKFIAKDENVITLDLQRSKKEREFKSLDGAAAVAKRIGFEWLNVHIGDMEWQEKV
ncbi:hypothetical protein Q4583_14745 [Neptunomonas phycophila]|jgi:hypothetical protein|uniref:Uncharacterized protein n=1 Tax=Neptunomonas phycophila TaxID=1572645 RepID=A0AAW7XJF3_9GAMM|nr:MULTISPECIES: hypothetical protein [Neptunomonas]MBT3144932.1 hypothetical protein [Neptunomonas phycophila]MDN2658428.1 hypothetical protein [Neptunomonas sp. CHC150]MDO6454255.1 hypothetical protein [Neptunomonas phycophila]MDO6468770.1 hypothetical protein [Neptunomonas phycophila]MDO6785375.1 hypothetical protein [Neptunomonas phycophila]